MILRPASGFGPGVEQRLDRRHDLQRLGHAARAGLAAFGHLAAVRTDEGRCRPSRAWPGCGGSPGAFHILGFIAGAISTGLSVASSTVEARSLASPFASFRHQVGGGRRDDDQVGLARQADVADVVLVLAVEEVGEDMVGRQRADRQRRDEFLRGGGHDAAHGGAALAQAADQVERLVGRDAAADDQEDALAGQCARCVARGAWGR